MLMKSQHQAIQTIPVKMRTMATVKPINRMNYWIFVQINKTQTLTQKQDVNLSFLLDQGEHRKAEQLPPRSLDPFIGEILEIP